MRNIEKLVRPNILELKPYSSARDEYESKEGVFLDANENPFGVLNRYPDPYQRKLKGKLSEFKGINSDQIFIGNGSDEIIDLAFRIFCTPGLDKALTFSPTYGMYEVSANINDVELLKIPLDSNFQINTVTLFPQINDPRVKLIFICSPNNPTGNLIDEESIEFILKRFDGIVIIDEAYIDFAQTDSMLKLLNKYNNLIVCQTLSKAWGMAATRIGMTFSSEEIISLFNKVKPPYNISQLNQQAALTALKQYDECELNKAIIINERKRLKTELNKLELVKKIYPSNANFLLIEVENANQLYADLVNQNIITRNRNNLIPNCIRVSVGTPEENNLLINALKQQS